MALTNTVKRRLQHTRVVTCKSYEREDGLWDIEGQVVDTKPYSFPNKDRGGKIEADEPLHDIWLRITIDFDLKIHAAEGVLVSSPHNRCVNAAPIAKYLVGLSIGSGWTKAIRKRIGGPEGCTHLFELLGPIATTALQTIYSAMRKHGKTDDQISSGDIPIQLQCYSYTHPDAEPDNTH